MVIIRRRKLDLLFCVPRARPENVRASTHFIRKIPASKHFITISHQFFAKHEKKNYKHSDFMSILWRWDFETVIASHVPLVRVFQCKGASETDQTQTSSQE